MARIIVRAEESYLTGKPLEIEVHTDFEGIAYARCPECDEMISVHGDFEDTVEEVARHVDVGH